MRRRTGIIRNKEGLTMKIRELNLKNFGKFSDKRVVFHDGVNIIYGENESGKTTLHTFIKGMLFGLERGRGRASAKDTFTMYEPWENPNFYAGVIRFESGGKRFCLTRTFDKYSKGASLICEDDGEEFSIEHGDLEVILDGLSMQDYENTFSIGQMKIETNQNLATSLQNYATNYYSTGNKDIYLNEAIEALNKKKKLTEKEIRNVLSEQQSKKAEIEREKSFVWREIQKLEEEIEELDEQIETYEVQKDDLESGNMKRWRVHPAEYVVLVGIMVLLYLLLDDPFNYLSCLVVFFAEGIHIWNRLKDGKKKPYEELLQEVSTLLQKHIWTKEHLQIELKERKTLMENMQEELEELEDVGEGYFKLEKRKQALDFASEKLLELSRDVHREIAYKLNQRASEILGEITDGRYSMLLVDEKLKMSLYTGDRKISIEQVSRGTIEQIYFALRMAASEILYEEEYPIILDDTFVFYDDVRLESTLRWLIKSQKQVIIFTCQKRENQILNKIKES